jgi:hypothetical protein
MCQFSAKRPSLIAELQRTRCAGDCGGRPALMFQETQQATAAAPAVLQKIGHGLI